MKKIFKLLVACLIVGVSIVSCEKDDFTEKDALEGQEELERLRDSLARVGGIVHYTVNVINAGNSGFMKSPKANGLSGVSVTTSQHGLVVTKQTDETGMVVFDDLRIGKVTVNISLANFTAVSYVAELTPTGSQPISSNTVRHASTQVPIFPLTGTATTTVSGLITYESDLTNATPEVAANIPVAVSIDVNSTFMDTYINTAGYDGTGQIVKIAYGDAVIKGTTDANGLYSLVVPTSASGLPIRLDIADVAVDQTLLQPTMYKKDVFGVQTVRTIFSQNSGYMPSYIPTVRPAYVTFSAPTGTTVGAAPTAVATADAILAQGEIEEIYISNAGAGYTQAPRVVITDATGTGATAEAVVSNGHVTAVNVTNSGRNYSATPTVTLEDVGKNAAATAEVAYGVKSITVGNVGAGYTKAPAVTFKSTDGYGSGATANAVMNGSLKKINITATGTGFSSLPTVTITGGNGTGAKATATLGAGQITTIVVPKDADKWYFVAPTVGLPFGATATATLKTGGRLTSINLSNGGTGYISAPTVTISGGGGSGASAYATISAGSVTSITIVHGGNGYTTAPTVSISGGSGSGASATVDPVTIEKQIDKVAVTDGGSGFLYTADYTSVILFNGFAITGTSYTLSCPLTGISINQPGTGFTSTPTVQITGGEGSGATAVAEVQYKVEAITVTNPGSGYLSAPQVVITGDGMETTKATATATLGYGILNRLVLTNPGEGYTAAPNVALTLGGASVRQAHVTARIEGDKVVGFDIVDAGTGYTSAPTVTISTKTTAATANATSKTGSVKAISITSAGAGYTVTPIVEFTTTDGFGTGAAATAVVGDNGKVVRIDVTNGGTGYTAAPTVKLVIPTTSLTAKGEVVVSADGVVTGVNLINDTDPSVLGVQSGNGYVLEPTVTITASVPGMGTGATAIARIGNGRVTSVVITNGGSGYKGQNIPGNFYPVNGAAVAGTNYLYSQPGIPGYNGRYLDVKSGTATINDIYLGTGFRTVIE